VTVRQQQHQYYTASKRVIFCDLTSYMKCPIVQNNTPDCTVLLYINYSRETTIHAKIRDSTKPDQTSHGQFLLGPAPIAFLTRTQLM